MKAKVKVPNKLKLLRDVIEMWDRNITVCKKNNETKKKIEMNISIIICHAPYQTK